MSKSNIVSKWDLGTHKIIQHPENHIQSPHVGKREERVIRLCKKPIRDEVWATYIHHWGLQIGDTWWECFGFGDKDPGDDALQFAYDIYACKGDSMSGIKRKHSKRVGTTKWTDEDIWRFSESWIINHKRYNFLLANCQMYATDLAHAATNGKCDMPPMQSSGRGRVKNPAFFTHNTEGEASFQLRGGEIESHIGPARAAAAAPKAKGSVMNGDGNVGAFMELDLGSAEVGAGPVKVRARPNVDTGVGFRDGNVEASFLGLGFKAGKGSIGIKTQVGDAECVIS